MPSPSTQLSITNLTEAPGPPACLIANTVPACHMVPLRRPTYAGALTGPAPHRPPPPRRQAASLMGRPMVSLPCSQLVLGRTTPPWYAYAWKTKGCEVRGDILRVEYPAGSGPFSSSRTPGGCHFKARPKCLPGTDVTLHYKVRFPESFDWGRGGKLPGLGVGPGKASGGRHTSDGASARLMWLDHGRLVAYVYVPTHIRQSSQYYKTIHRKGSYGDELFERMNLELKRGEAWNDIVVRVKLNGFDDENKPLHNGILTLGLNGKTFTREDIVWRTSPDIHVQDVMVTTFFGGKWTSPTDTYAEFSQFFVVG